MNDAVEIARNHYEPAATAASLIAKIEEAIAMLPDGPLSPAMLAGLDQFHVRGLAATAELAALANPASSVTVLDAGSGLGGASRYLAGRYGCSVVGVDLAPSFVAASRLLAGRTGLHHRVRYEVGNLLALPFPDGTFDMVWTQHVVMNIPGRERLYREFQRVLKPRGRMVFHDVVATDLSHALQFPLPWAETREASFLLTKEETLAALARSGFVLDAWHDVTPESIAWFGQQRPGPPNGLSLSTIMGPRISVMLENLGRNLREGRLGLAMGACDAASPARPSGDAPVRPRN